MGSKRHTAGSIKKRCDCANSRWLKCPHPWHFRYKHRQQTYRFSLHVFANKPESYQMGQSEAQEHARAAVNLIHAGKLDTRGRRIGEDAPPSGPSVEAVSQAYVPDYVHAPTRNERDRRAIERLIATGLAVPVKLDDGTITTFGALPIKSVTPAHLDTIKQARRQATKEVLDARKLCDAMRLAGEEPPPELVKISSRAPNLRNGEVGADRLLARLRHLFGWAVEKGYLVTTPFKRGERSVLKSQRKNERKRTRRLADGEQDALLAFANPFLTDLIVAALECCAREGELLALQWRDVHLDRSEIFIRAEEMRAGKTGKARTVHISEELRPILERRRIGADGAHLRGFDYVFGNELGEKVGSPRTAWENTVLKAHGHVAARSKTHALTVESRQALAQIDLEFRDFRREGASRLLERGWPLSALQELLGHTSLAQTADYLQVSKRGLHDAAARYGTGPVAPPEPAANGAHGGAHSAAATPAGAHLGHISPQAAFANPRN